jgi:type VI secretion system protein ImpL
MIASFLPNISPTLLLLGIALLIVLIFVLILWVLWRTKKKEEAPTEDAQVQPAQTEEMVPAEAAPQSAPAAKVTSSVSSAIRFVKDNSAGEGGRYRTPWFLVIGASGSGKSTLLEHSGIGLSLREGATDFGAPQGVHWRFFDGAVVLDVPGNFFMRADHTQSDEQNWKTLLRNLMMRRPQRPIDGVVLTIPCTELFGNTALAPVTIGQRAAHIFDKLWQIQKWLGLCFPVYVVVTKCDQVPGFKSLARQLPAHNRREMFGWSNPYNLDAAFESGWVDQGFEELIRQVNRLQCEVLVNRHDIDDADDLFLFSGRLLELRRPLRIYLGQIFKHSAYRESLQFRGFYFCGDGNELLDAFPEPARAMTAAAAASSSEPASSFYAGEQPAITGEVLGLTTTPVETPEAAPIFVTDLFENKIFRERGLARPVTRVSLSRNRWVIAAQVACALTVLVLAIGMTMNYRRLNDTQAAFVGILNRLSIDKFKPHDTPTATLSADEQDVADHLLRTVQSTRGYRFKTIFYPTSLLHPLDMRLEEAMVPLFNNLVLPSFRQQLLDKSKDLLTSTPFAESCNKNTPYMQDMPSYEQLCGFSVDLLRLQRNIDRYNRIALPSESGVPSDQDLKDLSEVEKYLTKHPLPDNFDKNPYFQVAFARSRGVQILTTDLDGKAADQRFRSLIRNFFEQWFTGNSAVHDLADLKERVDELGEAQTYDRLDSTEKLMGQVKTELGSSEFAWMGRDRFDLTPPLAEVTDDVIDHSGLFFSDVQRDRLKNFVQSTGDQQFASFVSKRNAAASHLIGDLLNLNNGGIQLSDNAEQLRVYLDKLLKQPFAQKKDVSSTPDTRVPRDSQLLWKTDVLQQAAALPDQYQGFIKDALANVPDRLHEPFDSIALDRLDAGIESGVTDAEKIEPLPPSQDPEESIVPELQSFQDALVPLESLLDHLHKLELTGTEDGLRESMVSQASNLLARIDNSYEQQAPYSTTGGNFDRWDGDNTATWAGFDAHTTEEVTQYVTFQRQQAQQYAQEAAPLVDFLSARSKDRGQTPLVVKWQGIVSDVQKVAKVPGTSLARLEDFISVDLPKVTPENCTTTASVGNSFFAERQAALRQSLSSRCQYLLRRIALRDYQNLAKFFNNSLAGKFPFSDPPQEQLPNEADPQDVVKLYGLLDSSGKVIRAGLDKGEFGDFNSQVLNFLKQLDSLRPAFEAILSGQPEAVPMLDFVPAFRVNQTKEINGNQIIDWTLQVGEQTFHAHDPERPGRWNFGDPVKLTLRWAKDSPQQPTASRQPVDGKLNSRTVTFEYRDSWSLFSMLALHHTPSSEFPRLVDPDPQTLMFDVGDTKSADPASTDSTPNPETRVFVRLRLRAPGKQDALRLKSFPTHAPEMKLPQVQTASGGDE